MVKDKNFGYKPGEYWRVSSSTKSIVGVFERISGDEMFLKPSLVYEPVYRNERMGDGTIRQVEEPSFREETERPTRVSLGSITMTEPISVNLYNNLKHTEVKPHITAPKPLIE